MGYCWTTGEKVKGRWKFLKCDGRSSRCAQDGHIVPTPQSAFKEVARCSSCNEYCSTYTQAKRTVIEYDRSMKE